MHKITLRNIHKEDIPQIIALQRESFSYMAMYGMIWPSTFLENHLRVFPEGQLCVELDKQYDNFLKTVIQRAHMA